MNLHTKFKALKARTAENGCTPGEVAAAEALLAKLVEKHPELNRPEPEVHIFHQYSNKTAGFTDWVKEGMRRAAEKAGKKPQTADDFADWAKSWDETMKKAQEKSSQAQEKKHTYDAFWDEKFPHLYDALSSSGRAAMIRWAVEHRLGEGDTAKLRSLARCWRHYGGSRSTFIDFVVDWDFNRATAATQWQRSNTQY